MHPFSNPFATAYSAPRKVSLAASRESAEALGRGMPPGSSVLAMHPDEAAVWLVEVGPDGAPRASKWLVERAPEPASAGGEYLTRREFLEWVEAWTSPGNGGAQ